MPEEVIAYQEIDLISGLQYLINYAARKNKPIVICLAIDTAFYAHDGRGSTNFWLSTQALQPGTAIVNGVGNEGNARRHFLGRIGENEKSELVELNVGPGEKGFSMEFWGSSPNSFTIDITSPYGEYIRRINIPFRETRKVTFVLETTVIYVDYQLVESQSGAELILMRFSDPIPGIWKINVYGNGIYPLRYHIWLPMNDFISKDTFFLRSSPTTTLLSVACSISLLTVTAYNTELGNLYLNSGRGYTSIQVVKPEIAAPGVNLVSPTPQDTFVEVTGTSAAAAHTAGIAAMLMEWGIIRKNLMMMNTVTIKTLLIKGAKRRTEIDYPNPDWGDCVKLVLG